MASAKARGIKVHAHADRPGSQVGDREEEGPPDAAEREAVRPVRQGARGALRRRRSTCGRSGTSPTSRSSCCPSTARASRTRPCSTAASTGRRTTRSAASPANRKDKILIGETSPRGNVHIVHPLTFLRGIACLNNRYKQARKCSRLKADGYAHHAYTTRYRPAIRPAGLQRRDDRRDLAARARARQGGRDGRDPQADEDLPRPSSASSRSRTRSPASRSSASRRTTRSPSTSPT